MHLILTLPLILYGRITQVELQNHSNVTYVVLSNLGLANYGINVIIYLLTSQVFRQELLKVLRHLFPKQQESESCQSSVATAATIL